MLRTPAQGPGKRETAVNRPVDPTEYLVSRASEDTDFRERLLKDPRKTIEGELGVTLDEDHPIYVHEDSYRATHLVLPPRNRFSEAEREESKAGAASLEFLRRTLHDPAPPPRHPVSQDADHARNAPNLRAPAEIARECIRRGLGFVESTIDGNGAWHCIRFNTVNPRVPRHYERPAFVSALCALALESSSEAGARRIRTATRAYLVDTIEYPGLWRYYRHLPQDLDSTSLCSLVIGSHPWVLLGRNIPQILANRDAEGRFQTWILADGEPDVVSRFRIEADPVVNANVIAYLGDRPETADALRWLESLVTNGRLEGSSRWYPDTVAICYAISRTMKRVPTALAHLRPMLAEHILALRDQQGTFGTILHTAQAVSALYNLGCLKTIDPEFYTDVLQHSQREDGSWPEFLAFGDQSAKWGLVGQIGHGSEAITSAFCIEALERLVEVLDG